MPDADPRLDEIRRLYYRATPATIHAHLTRAIEIMKSFETEEERERAAAYMDGLSTMRSEWAAAGRLPGESRRKKRRRPP